MKKIIISVFTGVVIILIFVFFLQEKPKHERDVLPPSENQISRYEITLDIPIAKNKVATTIEKSSIAPSKTTDTAEGMEAKKDAKENNKVIATGRDRIGYYIFTLFFPYDTLSLEEKPDGIIAIEGTIDDGYAFRISVPVWAHKYATNLLFRVSNRFDSEYEEIYADFLYTATTAGRYKLKLRSNPLRYEEFALVAKFEPSSSEHTPDFDILPLKSQ